MLHAAVVVAALSLAPPACAQVPPADANVALGKSYSCSSPGGIAWQGLLDGVVDSDAPPGCFATGNDPVFPKKIVIDLGAIYRLDQVVIHSSANGNTKKVDAWASRDGVGYTQLREPYVFPQGAGQRMSAKFPPLEARFVKIALWDTYGGGLGGDNVLYLREVEVMGRPTDETGPAKARPEVSAVPPRSARLFREYALRSGRELGLLVIGDDLAAPPPGGEGLATALAAELRAHFALPNVRVDDRSAPGLTAALASVMPVPADTSPDLVVIFLGVADALRFDAADFRAAVARLYAQLLEGTHALVVVVLPPRIPHSAQLDRAAECAGADTSQAAWQLATLASDIALVDAEAAIKKSGVPVTAAFADNLSLSDAGRKLIVQAVLALFP